MPVFQGVIFQSAGDAGWSNVYYISAADHAGAMSLLQDLNNKQLALQGATVFSLKLRVSDVTIKGDGYLTNPETLNGSLDMTGTQLAPLDKAVHFRFGTADRLHRVHHYIHGVRISDIATGPDGRTITTPAYSILAAVAAYVTAVEGDSVNWQKRSLPPVTAPLANGGIQQELSTRRVGRPFGQFRGRRRTA